MSKIVRMSDLFPSAYHEFHRVSENQQYLRYVLSGGRGSGKSTAIGFQLLLDIMKHPVSALVIRRVANTLQESVFNQLMECASIMGVDHLFRFNKSPLCITYIPRGNKILFRGGDEPQKIKSIKVAQFPIGILWIEELAEFKLEDEIITIEQSILRGNLPNGCKYKMYYSYNPPKRKSNWVNTKYSDITKMTDFTTYRLHTTYKDNPFISQASIDEAERMRESNEMKYRYVFLGEPIGDGIVPFDNLVIRRITDEEIANFSNARQGLDWGFANDALAFCRLEYDKTRRKIFIYDELYRTKLFNREVADWIKNKGYSRQLTICDSAEPKSISELKSLGVNCIGAKKGAGSVEFSQKWLMSLEEIIIDPYRVPNGAREFDNISFATTRDGEILSRLEDKDNHLIDSVAYACNQDMRNNTWTVY